MYNFCKRILQIKPLTFNKFNITEKEFTITSFSQNGQNNPFFKMQNHGNPDSKQKRDLFKNLFQPIRILFQETVPAGVTFIGNQIPGIKVMANSNR